MTEHNGSNPTFNFSGVDGAVYEQQPYHFNGAYTSQWWPSGTPSLIPPAPSPTNTARAQWTVPPTQAQQNNHRRSGNVNQRSINIDPRLQGSHQSLPRLDTRQSLTNQPIFEPVLNPIARFYQQDSEPWNALSGMRNPRESIAQNNFLQAQVNYGQHRKGPGSDLGSNVPTSDSGYYTQQTTSVLSDEPIRVHLEPPIGMSDQARNLIADRPPTVPQSIPRRPSDQRSVLSHRSSRSASHKQLFPCPETGCLVVSKCLSEYKKHMLKHDKHFICDVQHCRRAGKGFSTINDLDRHKKSVHKIGVDKSMSYKCAASSCARRDKIWPRLDNFKQHIERMHKEWNIIELIRNSEYQPSQSVETQQTLVMDPSLLAGLGDPNDALTSSNSHNSPYQSSVSFHAGSMSSAPGLSPNRAAADASFSQFKAPLPVIGNTNLSKDSSIPSPVRNVSNIPNDRHNSTRAPSADMPSTTGPMPTATKDHRQLQLSNAPQTKSEQQKALAKLSKANINIEEFLQRALGAQQQQDGGSTTPVLSETEMLHVSQAIADLVKQKSKNVRPQQRRSTQGSSSSTQYCEFKGCNFSGRICDLNKHRKRHQKPYGCTYPKCHKRFGAKSDWKRHESSQHFQLEAYRCDHPSPARRQKCGQHCYRPVQFQKHLAEKHKITSETEVQASLKRCKIGKNCQGRFWCGFCGEIQNLRTKRNAAWDERFDHIAVHFEKDNMSIDEWLCVEENRTKAQLRLEMDRAVFEDDDSHGVDSEAKDDERSFRYEAATTSLARLDAQGPTNSKSAPKEVDIATRSQKRSRHPAKKPRRQCCECSMVWTVVQVDCYGCFHVFCDGCERVYVDDNDRADDDRAGDNMSD